MERQQHEQPPQEPLSVLRGVESTPPGDLAWAEHCTRQQAVILGFLLTNGRTTSLAELGQTIGVKIRSVDELPVPGTSFPTADGWHIHVDSALPADRQLLAALHQLKHVIDHPVRRAGVGANLTSDQYELLADYFAELVVGEGNTTETERRNSP